MCFRRRVSGKHTADKFTKDKSQLLRFSEFESKTSSGPSIPNSSRLSRVSQIRLGCIDVLVTKASWWSILRDRQDKHQSSFSFSQNVSRKNWNPFAISEVLTVRFWQFTSSTCVIRNRYCAIRWLSVANDIRQIHVGAGMSAPQDYLGWRHRRIRFALGFRIVLIIASGSMLSTLQGFAAVQKKAETALAHEHPVRCSKLILLLRASTHFEVHLGTWKAVYIFVLRTSRIRKPYDGLR